MYNLTKKLIETGQTKILLEIETARVALLNEGYTQVRWAHMEDLILWVKAIKPVTGKTYFLNRPPYCVTAMFDTVDLSRILDIIRVQYARSNACATWSLAINDVTDSYTFDPISYEQYEAE